MNPKNKFVISVIILLGLLFIVFSFRFPYAHKKYPPASNNESPSHLEELNLEKKIQQETKKEMPRAEAIRVPILVYHSIRPYYLVEPRYIKEFDIEPDIFEKQLQYLRDDGYTVIPFDTLIYYFLNDAPLPSKPIVFTFDDGWENQYTYAFPLLKKYNDTATFFIYTNAIGHKHFLTWQQVKDLKAAGMTIGSHTKSHPYLIKIITKQKLMEEIADSKKIIEEHLGDKIDFFAYPFGHYNNQIINVVKEAGYQAARGIYKGTYHTKDELFTLRAILANNNFDKFIEDLKKI